MGLKFLSSFYLEFVLIWLVGLYSYFEIRKTPLSISINLDLFALFKKEFQMVVTLLHEQHCVRRANFPTNQFDRFLLILFVLSHMIASIRISFLFSKDLAIGGCDGITAVYIRAPPV